VTKRKTAKKTTKRRQKGGGSSDWKMSQYSYGPSNTLESVKNDPALFGQFNTTQQYVAPQDMARLATPSLVGEPGNVVPVDPDAGLQAAVGGAKKRKTTKHKTTKRKTVKKTTKRKTVKKTTKRKTVKKTTKRKTVKKTTKRKTTKKTTRKPKTVMNRVKALFK